MKRWTFLALIMVLALCGLQFAAAQESTPESTSGGAPEQIELVLSALSTEVGQTVALTDLDAYQWNQQMFNDASLGCPEPDTLYAQVITPGFQFLLSFGGLTYDYRVAEANDEVRLCGVSDTPLTSE